MKTFEASATLIKEDPLFLIPRLGGKARTFWMAATYPFAGFGKGTWAHYSCHVSRSDARYIQIGADVGLQRDVRLEAYPWDGISSPILIVEDGCALQRRTVISARNQIHIMRNTIIAHSVVISDHKTDRRKARASDGWREEPGGRIRIEEDCWIGFGVSIICEQGELVIGRHCVVGANSIIRQSVPAYSVILGNPPRIVKQFDSSKNKWALGCTRPMADADRIQDSILPVATSSELRWAHGR